MYSLNKSGSIRRIQMHYRAECWPDHTVFQSVCDSGQVSAGQFMPLRTLHYLTRFSLDAQTGLLCFVALIHFFLCVFIRQHARMRNLIEFFGNFSDQPVQTTATLLSSVCSPSSSAIHVD